MRNVIATMICVSLLAACGGGGSSNDAPTVAAVPAAAPATLLDPGMEEAAATFAPTASAPTGGDPALPNLVPSINDSGFAATFSKAGVIDRTGPFFQSLGANGRSCSSCHIQAEGWTIIACRRAGAFRENRGSRSDLPTCRRIELTARGCIDGRYAPSRLQHAAFQGIDPRRDAHSGRRGVRAGRSRRPVRLRERKAAVTVPSATAKRQRRVPEHGHVGWPRNLQGPDFAGLRAEHHELLRHIALRSRQSIEQRHAGACRSQAAADAGAAQRDRRFRDGAFCRADLRS